jgi:hypothetical protein
MLSALIRSTLRDARPEISGQLVRRSGGSYVKARYIAIKGLHGTSWQICDPMARF